MNVFPWRRADAADEPEEGAEGAWEGDEPEGDEPEGDEPEEPTLEGLDDEARSRAEAYARSLVEAERKGLEKIRQGAQQLGVTFDADGNFGVTDLSRLASRLGVESGQPAPPPAAGTQAAPEDPRPNMFDDPEGYQAWAEREMDRRAQAAVAGVKEENERLKGLLYEQGARSALGTVEQAVQQYAPALAACLQHPDFRGLYEKGIAGQPPEWLADPRNLARVAGWIAPELDPARMPAPERPRDDRGRYAQDPVYRANRESIPAAGGGRGGMAVPRDQRTEQLSPEEAKILRAVEQVGGPISREQMIALEQPDFGSYQETLARLTRGRQPQGRR